MYELGTALDMFQKDKDVGAIVLTGSDRAFAGKCIKSHMMKQVTDYSA